MRRVGPSVLAVLSVLGVARPAVAQVDLSGMWARRSHEDAIHRGAGPELGDYTGIPINAAGRLKAESWDASILSLPEEQAKPHAAQYSMRGPGPNFRMGAVVDPVTQQLVAYTINNLFGNADRTIWLDGRAHPSQYAEHTWSGFSTGAWEGNMLKVTTTHMKAGWLQSAPTGEQAPAPFAAWPSLTFFGQKHTTSYNREPIEVLFEPNAHTDGDLIVFFRRSDVISTGSVFTTTGYPVIDLQRGGTVQGTLDALNHIIDIAIPEFNQQRGTLIVPGHGRICNESDVVEYRDMVTIIRDRIQRMIGQGMTLAQVKAAGPTLDYDGLYGSTTGPWTTEMFIEAVYQDLNRGAIRSAR